MILSPVQEEGQGVIAGGGGRETRKDRDKHMPVRGHLGTPATAATAAAGELSKFSAQVTPPNLHF